MGISNGFRETITPREYELHQWEVDMFEKQAAHAVQLKELDIQAAKLEAKISSWFKVPLYLLMLPVRVLLVIPLCIYAARKHEVPEALWALFR